MKNLLAIVSIFVAAQAYAQPDSSTYFYQKGIEEKTAKHYLVASKNFDQAIKLNPKYTEAYLENGYVNIEMRKTDVAITNFSKANQLDPSNNAAINELMNLYFNYRQYYKALEFAQKCKDCANANKVIGISYYNQEDYGKAEKTLLEVASKNPNDGEVNYTLARTYNEMEQSKKAILYYEKAVAADTTRAAWFHELALLYYTADNYKAAALNFYKAANKGFPQSNDFNENFGFSLMYSGQTERGEKLLLEIVAKKPGNTDILRDIAQAYYDQKQYDKSLDFCQKLMEINEKDAQALYQAGMCFQKKGQKEKGQGMCDKAIQMDPSLAKMKKEISMPGGL